MPNNPVINTDMRTLLAVIAGVAAGVAAWVSLKGDVAEHSKQLAVIQGTVSVDHDNLVRSMSVMENMDKKLDYISGARRERPPAGTPTTPGSP